MIQEESSLLNCDKSAWQELMQTRFQLMERFPSLSSLAQASVEDVCKVWEGLDIIVELVTCKKVPSN